MTVSLSIRRLAVAVLVSVVALAVPARANIQEKTMTVRGLTVHYKVVLPNGYDPAKTFAGIIALGGGPQTMNTVDGLLNRTSGPKPRSADTSSWRQPRRTVNCSSKGATGSSPTS
jgi:ABC-type oligopeptide transport system substrate-binding subunit